jgi:hypothetical protein
VTDLPASEARVPDVARRDELTVAVMEASRAYRKSHSSATCLCRRGCGGVPTGLLGRSRGRGSLSRPPRNQLAGVLTLC